MKSSNPQFSNNNSFNLRSLLCTILALTIFGVTVNHGAAVNNNITENADGANVHHTVENPNEEKNYTAAVSTFTMSYSNTQSTANIAHRG